MIYVHYVLILVTLVATPLLIALLYVVFRLTPGVWNPVINAWLLMNMISSLCAIGYYFYVIRDLLTSIHDTWQENMTNDEIDERIALAKASGGQISEADSSEGPEPPRPYYMRERFMGNGPIRIG